MDIASTSQAAGAIASSAHTQVVPSCRNPTAGHGLHEEEPEATAMLSIRSHGTHRNVAGILDLDTHQAVEDLDADADLRAAASRA